MSRAEALLFACAFLTASGGCARWRWSVGGLYSLPDKNGSFCVVKILKVDQAGVHIRMYSNEFPDRPADVDEAKLYLVAADKKKTDEILGMGHVPVSKKTFSSWGPRFIKVVPVKDEELEGYRIWLEAKAGYF